MTDDLPESVTRPLHMLWLAQTGPGMTAAQIDYVAVSELPGERDWNAGGFRASSIMMNSLYPVIGPNASVYLYGAGLIAPAANQTFKITDQGVALLKGAMGQSVETNAVFKLDPEAPLDYIGLLSELDSLEDPIVVDSDFHPHDYSSLVAALPGVKLITIDADVAKVDAFAKPKLKAPFKRSLFEDELGRQVASGPAGEVIYVPSSELHDRYFLGANRQGYFAGGSFRSSKPTVVMELEANHADELYSRYKLLCESADATALTPRVIPGSESGPSGPAEVATK
jgi:hypothetical protein